MSMIEVLVEICPDAKTIFDVGAKAGDYAAYFAIEFPRAVVYAFEPEPNNFEKLSLKEHPGIIPINLAVYKDCGLRTLNRYLHSGSHSMYLPDKWDPGALLNSVAVKAVSVDAFCEELEIPEIDILKIDVEGAELDVLTGAVGILGRGAIKVVVVELMFYPYFKGQPKPGQIIDFLEQRGMMMVAMFPVFYEGKAKYANAIFVKKGDAF